MSYIWRTGHTQRLTSTRQVTTQGKKPANPSGRQDGKYREPVKGQVAGGHLTREPQELGLGGFHRADQVRSGHTGS